VGRMDRLGCSCSMGHGVGVGMGAACNGPCVHLKTGILLERVSVRAIQ